MKKIIFIALMLVSMLTLQSQSRAQDVGLGDVVFEENTTSIVEHGFLMNDLSYTIIKLHLIIAGKDIEAVDYEGETLTTIKRLEELTKTDVIDVINLSTNKQEALIKYLTDCDQELQKGDTIAAYMKQEMNILKGEMEACLVDKNVSDKVYFDAVERYDQSMMEVSLNESIIHETCATEKRIQYNAKTSIAQKLVFYLGLLQKKYDLLFAKQEILAQNFEVFRDKILPDLNQIDALLQQYKF
ncbi:MAG: hypothetical protein WC010_01460 [Candidatus Absconditabacterales bacterium]